MKQFLLDVLNDIKPSPEYEKDVLARADSIIKKINKGLKDAKAVLGGSGAKGTYLKTFDVDIFVKFSYAKYKDKNDELSGILEKFLKKSFKISRIHGSRDYFQIKHGDFTFEIVPILDIRKAEQSENITDVSPLHSTFVLKHRKLSDEMRLTKQFFKAAGVYGAESYIRGFSGYVCEILAINYGSFMGCIKAASKWKEKEVIDVKNYYKNKDVFQEINKSKLTGPLVVIDPVQKDRNAAAAISIEKFEMLRKRAKDFLKNPSKKFFEIETLTEESIRKKSGNKNIIFIEVTPLKRKIDVAGAKMNKAFDYIKMSIVSYGFDLVDSGFVWDKKGEAFFYYILKDMQLQKNMELSGPPLNIKKHVALFKKKHKNTFIRDGKIFALESRKFTDAKSMIKSIFKISNINDNVAGVRIK
jgi:tRNA nucleotidyltransferase (CCA-adding enzyme)